MKKCTSCGNRDIDEVNFCSKCGSRMVRLYEADPVEKRPAWEPKPERTGPFGLPRSMFATIVVIIVLIAAIGAVAFYVINEPNGAADTPIGAWRQAQALGNASGKVVFGNISVVIAIGDVELHVLENGTEAGYFTWHETYDALVWHPGSVDHMEGTFFTMYSHATVGAGSYVRFDILKPGTTYGFTLVYIPSGHEMGMTGPNQFKTLAA